MRNVKHLAHRLTNCDVNHYQEKNRNFGKGKYKYYKHRDKHAALIVPIK